MSEKLGVLAPKTLESVSGGLSVVSGAKVSSKKARVSTNIATYLILGVLLAPFLDEGGHDETERGPRRDAGRAWHLVGLGADQGPHPALVLVALVQQDGGREGLVVSVRNRAF